MLHHRWMMGLVTFGIVLWGGQWGASPPPPGSQPVVRPTDEGLMLEWRAPQAVIVPEAEGTVTVAMRGYARLNQPGAPQLPFASALVALPPGSNPTIEVLLVEEKDIALPGALTLAPQPEGVQRDASGQAISGSFVPAPEAHPFHLPPVELEVLGALRGVRLARLTFYPVRPLPMGGGLRLTARLQAVLRFPGTHGLDGPPLRREPRGAGNAPAQTRTGQDLPDPFLSALRSVVVNPYQLQPLPGQRGGEFAQRPRQAGATVAIEVGSQGLTAIAYDVLAGIGFPVAGINPHNLHLTRAGNEMAAEWDGDADSSFEPGERLLFYANPRFSRWTATDVYFLSEASVPGLRVTSRSADPAGLPGGAARVEQTAETNAFYMPNCYCGRLPPGRDGDRWAWDVLRRPDRSSASYTLTLPTVDAAQPASLRVWFISYTDVAGDPDHRVDISLNGALLGHAEWNGRRAITSTLTVPPGLLSSGTNTVTLTLPGLSGVSLEGAWLDAISMHYARGSGPVGYSILFTGEAIASAYTLVVSSTAGLRAYDVTDPDHPARLSDLSLSEGVVTLGDDLATGGPRRYALAGAEGILSPVQLRLITPLQPATGADYLIIAPSTFTPALASLVALRQSQGLSVVVEDVQAVYDSHDGRPTPGAIRAYLANAYAAWSPRPTYVLLVGDGTSDPRRYRSTSSVTFIPPYLADVDPWAGETAADNRYVTLDGSDSLPDMLLGRLPVNTLGETQAVVNKIVGYESSQVPGLWNGNVTFVADDADTAGDFAAESQALAAAFITAPFTSQLINLSPPVTQTITTTWQAITERWNAGAGLIVFNGHASIHQWAAERLFHLDDVAGLINAGRLPVVFGMTCFTSAFQTPDGPTLDEALLRHPNGGAVAAWGATGLGVATGHGELAHGFLQSVYANGQPGLGAAALAGKVSLAALGLNGDLIDTFTLLGDPATQLDLTLEPSSSLFFPFIQR